MKKMFIIVVAFAFMPFLSIASNVDETIGYKRITKEVKTNSDEWTPIGKMEIVKILNNRTSVTQKVQVFRNSDGTRAIKDGRYYRELRENPQYGRFPADECLACGYRLVVFYEGDNWYTNGIVKQEYGSY